MTITNCPLCKAQLQALPAFKNATALFKSIADIRCPCCGVYGIDTSDLELKAPQLTDQERATLAAFVCERSLDDKKAVILWSEPTTPVNVREEVWISFQRVMDEFPLPPITDKFDRSLLNLSRMARPGQGLVLGPCHFGALYSEDRGMLGIVLEQLLARGYLRGSSALPSNFTITSEGWIRVEELNRGHLTKENRQAFVAMWFDPSMDAAFSDGIAPAIKDAGFAPFRVDRMESNNQITDEIVAGIRRSRFMVADVTGNRPAVYYEAGLMHGLGRPVIFTCKDNHLGHASFDTNHYPHIQWKTTTELREKLLNRIQATIVD